MENKYQPVWEKLERSTPRPTRVRNIIQQNFSAFKEKVLKQEDDFVQPIIESIYAGDVYLLKKTFPEKFMRDLRDRVDAYWKKKPSEFYKMLEGCPDFHRVIDLEEGKKYSFHVCKHACYFYHWNGDPLDLFPIVNERWRVIKFLTGLQPEEYEKNTPKDGVVDRLQVVRYPPKIGFLELHSDPYLHQRVFFSGYMSKRGQDYQGGGFYLVGPGDKVVEVEDRVDIGDVGIGCATVCHGVAPCDQHEEPDWNSKNGRWFLSMYSNASDEMKNRHTGHAVKLVIEGVAPKNA